MNYSREIGDRSRWIAEYEAKIAALQAELDQLWSDEAIAKVDHEVPLGPRNEPQPIRCRKCRKEPSLVTTKQRQVDAVVNGRLTRVWQDYYVYRLTSNNLWCKKCSDTYLAEIRKQRDLDTWWEEHKRTHPDDYYGGC